MLAAPGAAARAPAGDALARQAAQIRHEMQLRGDAAGEISLALAGLYARGRRKDEVYRYVNLARQQGVSATRTDLLLGAFFRRAGRCDAALTTLLRVLDRHEEQPYALVEVWKTLYRCALEGATLQADAEAARKRLLGLGLHLPQQVKVGPEALEESARLCDAAYGHLLAGRAELAAEIFEGAIDNNPSNSRAHRGLGIARARTQDYLRAAGAYLIYLSLEPDAPDADAVDRILMEYWRSRARRR